MGFDELGGIFTASAYGRTCSEICRTTCDKLTRGDSANVSSISDNKIRKVGRKVSDLGVEFKFTRSTRINRDLAHDDARNRYVLSSGIESVHLSVKLPAIRCADMVLHLTAITCRSHKLSLEPLGCIGALRIRIRIRAACSHEQDHCPNTCKL